MFVRNITFFALVMIMSCSTDHPRNGFDSACVIFKEASTKNLNPEQLGNYITERLDQMDEQTASEDVNEVYHSLFNVDPAERYGLFKESAETALNRKWDCEVIDV